MESDNFPEHNWSTFAMCFVGTFPYIPHDKAPPECAWRVGDSRETFESDFRRAEAPFIADIEATIRTLCSTGAASHDSRAVQYFLGIRGAVLESFFLSFSIPRGGAQMTIIPFPQLPPLRVVEWFLIDWWRHQGGRCICEMRLLDAHYG